jgi:hypothetical protein
MQEAQTQAALAEFVQHAGIVELALARDSHAPALHPQSDPRSDATHTASAAARREFAHGHAAAGRSVKALLRLF